MIPTFGLTHVALAVRDAERALRFHAAVCGGVAVSRAERFVRARTRGPHDALVFEETGGAAGARGRVLRRAAFVAGEPHVFFVDADGYEVEVWYGASFRRRWTRLDAVRGAAGVSVRARAWACIVAVATPTEQTTVRHVQTAPDGHVRR